MARLIKGKLKEDTINSRKLTPMQRLRMLQTQRRAQARKRVGAGQRRGKRQAPKRNDNNKKKKSNKDLVVEKNLYLYNPNITFTKRPKKIYTELTTLLTCEWSGEWSPNKTLPKCTSMSVVVIYQKVMTFDLIRSSNFLFESTNSTEERKVDHVCG